MKKMLGVAVRISFFSVVFYFLLCFAAYAFTFQPISNFSGWQEWVNNSASFEVEGSTVTMNVSGSDGFGNCTFSNEFQGSIGMMVTVNVSSIGGTSQSGIAKFEIGQNESGNRIQALVYVASDGEKKTISFNVHERDSQTNEYLGVLLDGVLGGYSEPIVGSSITIALARVGNEIWFHASGKGILKYDVPGIVSGIPTPKCEFWGAAKSGNTNSVTATYSNLFIIYE